MKNPYVDLTKEKAEFLAGKIEAAIDRTIADRDIIQKKSTVILGIIGAAITLCVGELLEAAATVAILQHYLFIETILLVIAGLLIIATCLMPREYATKGGEPRVLMAADFVNQALPNLITSYALRLQDAITFNNKQLLSISRWLKAAAVLAITSPGIAALIHLAIGLS